MRITDVQFHENGCIRVPDAPGLGVELDCDELARLEEENMRTGDKVFYADKLARRNPAYMGQW